MELIYDISPQNEWNGLNNELSTPFSLDLEIIENPTIPKDVTLSAVASSYFVPRKEDKKDKIFQQKLKKIRDMVIFFLMVQHKVMIS